MRSAARRLALHWRRFARPVDVTSADGGRTAQTRATLRAARQDELIAGADQQTRILVALVKDLEAVDFYPLPRMSRVKENGETYTVEESRTVYVGTQPTLVKAWCQG